MSTNKYYQQAEQQYNPSYNSKVQALKNQLAQNQQSLEQQKTGINQNYDLQVNNANLNNRLNKNVTSNAMLGRGLANSSIAISGLAEQDAKNTRIIGNIERGRLADLNNIDEQKALLGQNFNNTLAQMEADKLDAINALAMQLEDRDWNKDFQNRQLAQQYALAEMQKQYQYAQLAQAQAQFEASQAWKQKEWEYQQQLAQAQQSDAFKNKIDNIAVDPSISSSDKYNALTQLYYNQSGNESNQQYLMDTYLRLMNANNTGSSARSLTPTSQNLYSGISQEEARKKIGYEYNSAYDFITNRR